jgi:hypothetical protein
LALDADRKDGADWSRPVTLSILASPDAEIDCLLMTSVVIVGNCSFDKSDKSYIKINSLVVPLRQSAASHE